MNELTQPPEWQLILIQLESKHGPAVKALLTAIHKVAVELGKPFDNYWPIQNMARELGCTRFLSVLADLELAGVVERHKGDIYFPIRPDWKEAGWGQDPAVLSVVEEFLKEPAVSILEGPPSGELPADLFQDIVGHDEVKELLRAAVSAPRPVHVLLSGPPALAKSLFLWELERVSGSRACWVLGSASSKAGLQEVLLEHRPYLLLVDELDKMDGRDQAVLLSVMEGGRLSRIKHGRMADETLGDLRVVAASNIHRKLATELLSRFALRIIQPYTRDEFQSVVKGVLVRREGVSAELAEDIAQRLDGQTQDVRDAIRVCRLAPQLGVEKAVKLLLGGN